MKQIFSNSVWFIHTDLDTRSTGLRQDAMLMMQVSLVIVMTSRQKRA